MSSTVMMGRTAEKSPLPQTRIVDIFFLLCLVTGIFALMVRIPAIIGALALWLLAMGASAQRWKRKAGRLG
jgi:hypothetical protein